MPINWPIPELGSPVPRTALELQHEDYKARISDWEFFRHSDELTGGYSGSVQDYTSSTSIPTFNTSYLVPHEKEDGDEFARRVALATPPRYVQEGITSIVGVLTEQEPNRNEYPDGISEWMSRVNIRGDSLQQVIASEIAPLVERYGLMYTLSARPEFGGDTEGEQKEALEAAGVPEVLLHLISPEAVQWWVEDDTGRFEIVRYVETVTEFVYDGAYVVDEKDVERHWYITDEGWWYVDDPKETTTSGTNPLKVDGVGYWEGPGQQMTHFPLVRWQLKDQRAPTEVASFAQLAYYRAESELKKIEEASAFSMLWVPVETSDANPTEVVKGPDPVGGFPSEGSHTPLLLEPSGVSFTHFVEHRLPELEEAALSPYGRSREVGGNDSGVALAHIQETAVNIYRTHAKAFSSSEFAMLLPTAELLGDEMPQDAKAEWPTDFGTLSDQKQMESLQMMLDADPGEEYEAYIISKMGQVTLSELTDKQRQEADEAYKKRQEEAKVEESEMRDLEVEEKQFAMAQPAAMNPAVAGVASNEKGQPPNA